MDFISLSRNALDIWSQEEEGSNSDSLILKLLPLTQPPGINLHRLNVDFDKMEDFVLQNIVEKTDQRRRGATRMGDHPDQAYVEANVFPAFMEARDTGHPVIDCVSAKAVDRYYIYDRVILPQKCSAPQRALWLVAIVWPRLILPIPEIRPQLTEAEADILKCLMMGEQPKEIAPQLNLSRRAIEHRIQSLKAKYGARNVTHLVALAITNELVG
ncbi:helix-turn-helix transcriptional regulator [Roseibium sp.]|uniref:helix-turn-helix transcriptional regulator n=1 Tax=Roseibium sp. TaxID=1936156 RepID=UPI003A969062